MGCLTSVIWKCRNQLDCQKQHSIQLLAADVVMKHLLSVTSEMFFSSHADHRCIKWSIFLIVMSNTNQINQNYWLIVELLTEWAKVDHYYWLSSTRHTENWQDNIVTFLKAGAILLVSVPATMMTSACLGLALNTTPNLSMSYRGAAMCIISTAQHARPKVSGHKEPCKNNQ